MIITHITNSLTLNIISLTGCFYPDVSNQTKKYPAVIGGGAAVVSRRPSSCQETCVRKGA